MCSQKALDEIVRRLMAAANQMSGNCLREAILFGSYARRDADSESDVDVMLLVSIQRDKLVNYRHALALVAGEMLMEYGIVVSPVLENYDFFQRNVTLYPFFMNISREGIRYAS